MVTEFHKAILDRLCTVLIPTEAHRSSIDSRRECKLAHIFQLIDILAGLQEDAVGSYV